MQPYRGQIDTPHGRLAFGGRTLVVGILNVTPDSFSDGGLFASVEAAAQRAVAMAGEGADLIDIGGESTRPGSDAVAADEQIRRVEPVIRAARRGGLRLPLSIDTRSAAVAEAALEAGADLVNDVSALRADGAMAGVVARRGAAVVLMHMQGDPKTMQAAPRYDDVVREVAAFLEARAAAAVAAGILRERIIVDPGIGFGKTAAHNWELLRRLGEFDRLDLPLLVGPSRKAFIGARLGIDEPRERLFGTAAAVAACALAGAALVRVHDVRAMRQVVEVCAAIAGIPSGETPDATLPASSPPPRRCPPARSRP